MELDKREIQKLITGKDMHRVLRIFQHTGASPESPTPIQCDTAGGELFSAILGMGRYTSQNVSGRLLRGDGRGHFDKLIERIKDGSLGRSKALKEFCGPEAGAEGLQKFAELSFEHARDCVFAAISEQEPVLFDSGTGKDTLPPLYEALLVGLIQRYSGEIWMPGHLTRVFALVILSNIESKLLQMKETLPEEYAAALGADRSYRYTMKRVGWHHLSEVHPYFDTLAHGVMLAVMGATPQEKAEIAYSAISSHLLDDCFDMKVIKDMREAWKLGAMVTMLIPPPISQAINEIAKIGSQEGLNDLVRYSAASNLIYQAKGGPEQQEWCDRFKRFLIDKVRGHPIASALRKLTPLQISTLSHVGLSCFLAIEGPHSPALPVLYDALYAPLLYCHDRERERDVEGNKLFIEPELVRDGLIADEYLTPLVDIFLNYHDSVPDDRRERRYRQVLLVLKGHKHVIADMHPALQKKYAEAAALCERELKKRSINADEEGGYKTEQELDQVADAIVQKILRIKDRNARTKRYAEKLSELTKLSAKEIRESYPGYTRDHVEALIRRLPSDIDVPELSPLKEIALVRMFESGHNKEETSAFARTVIDFIHGPDSADALSEKRRKAIEKVILECPEIEGEFLSVRAYFQWIAILSRSERHSRRYQCACPPPDPETIKLKVERLISSPIERGAYSLFKNLRAVEIQMKKLLKSQPSARKLRKQLFPGYRIRDLEAILNEVRPRREAEELRRQEGIERDMKAWRESRNRTDGAEKR